MITHRFLTKLLLLSMFGLFFPVHSEAFCRPCISTDAKIYAVGAIAIAAGITSIYAVTHEKRGKRGRQGPEGPPGPPGPGFELTTEELNIGVDNLTSGNVAANYTLLNPINEAIYNQDINPFSPSGTTILSPQGELKLSGTYILVLEIIAGSLDETAIGTFTLSGTPFTLLSGKDPAVSQTWTTGETSVLQASFP